MSASSCEKIFFGLTTRRFRLAALLIVALIVSHCWLDYLGTFADRLFRFLVGVLFGRFENGSGRFELFGK